MSSGPISSGPGSGWRRHLTYSNVISTLTVFLVLAGGTALAATKLPKNSVTSKTVKDNSLTSADLADGRGVTGADVADGSLSGADLAANSLNGAKLEDGSVGGADFANGSIGAADLAKGAVGRANLAPNALDSSSIVDGSIQGSDVGTDRITDKNIALQTLGPVPEAVTLERFVSDQFLSAQVKQFETPIETGQSVAGGNFRIKGECQEGTLLSAGPANLSPGTSVVESAPNGLENWTVEINPHGAADPFSVVVLCAVRAR